jgi:hypothetical protein
MSAQVQEVGTVHDCVGDRNIDRCCGRTSSTTVKEECADNTDGCENDTADLKYADLKYDQEPSGDTPIMNLTPAESEFIRVMRAERVSE